MSIAANAAIETSVLSEPPAVATTLDRKSPALADVIKVGRTHLMDCDAIAWVKNSPAGWRTGLWNPMPSSALCRVAVYGRGRDGR